MSARGEIVTEVLDFLASLPVFSKISETSLQQLAHAGRFQPVEKGEVLFFQSDPADLVYIVRSGEISILLNSLDGREMVINEMHTGDLFGELGILTNQIRSTSAIAHSKSDLLIFPSWVFSTLLESDPQFALYMLQINARRLQESSERESALAFMDAQARLARLLLELETQKKQPIQIGIGIATGTMIAGYAGTQQRALYTCIGDTVNLAARIEDYTKKANHPIVIDQYTQEGLSSEIKTEELGPVLFKGKQQQVNVFAVNIK